MASTRSIADRLHHALQMLAKHHATATGRRHACIGNSDVDFALALLESIARDLGLTDAELSFLATMGRAKVIP